MQDRDIRLIEPTVGLGEKPSSIIEERSDNERSNNRVEKSHEPMDIQTNIPKCIHTPYNHEKYCSHQVV